MAPRTSSGQVPLRASVSDETAQEIREYSGRYGSLFEDINADLDELFRTRSLSRAQALADATRQCFNHNEYPHYFFGDLDARVVLVHLNPREAENCAPRFDGEFPVRFEAYFDAHRHFGARNYGEGSPTHKSPFDHKQVRFLRPFGAIDFEPDRPENRFTNLERVIDRKLQLELVPYGSPSFSSDCFTQEILRPHYERIMRVIAATPRAYVIFCGAVFGDLLGDHVVGAVEEFHLKKRDRTPTRQKARFARMSLPWDGQMIEAGLAHSWARQGLPMESYGREVAARYKPTPA